MKVNTLANKKGHRHSNEQIKIQSNAPDVKCGQKCVCESQIIIFVSVGVLQVLLIG